jgi:uncharacterized protein YbjT (DUF2867 family)
MRTPETVVVMAKTTDGDRLTLILGGSGRTGSLIANRMRREGVPTRTASRHDSDIRFDWDDPGTYANALMGVDSVYLVTPTMRVRYLEPVSRFLDLAETAGVKHVTLLSTFNGDRAPQEIDVAAVEDDVANRARFTHSILRPAWVMQNFADDHLPIIDGRLVVPSGGGAEALSTLSMSPRSRFRPSCIPANTRVPRTL